ncbi:hypothetical protein [Paraburkholderia aspalathi]|uniref:Uncharacterized protein n=1 Tax=Paraburkholderia aspalathi TaxID=1324617 RepID=A0A1I7BAS0_9BURK|nr:hypothetical protein [Paraburkholderia aspalathi]SFT84234.1 hypothetical protein SAMN05192563_1004321 [Paraburkholderia aspalathi]
MSNCSCRAVKASVDKPRDVGLHYWPGVRTKHHARTSGTLAHAANRPVDEGDPSQQAFRCRDGRILPRYTNRSVGLSDGLYLGLFNGRDDPLGSPLVDGFDGPLIGRLRYCHTIRARDIELEVLDPFEARLFFPDMAYVAGPDGEVLTAKIVMPIPLMFNSGAIVFDGRYFADWTVFIISAVRTATGRDLRAQQRV